MDISTKHQNAVIAACRIPALNARLALLAQPDPGQPERSVIRFYGTAKPGPGDPPGESPLVTLTMTAAAGTIDAGAFELVFDTPLESQVTGADPSTGTIPLWARVLDVEGDWWADLTVTVAGGGGDIELPATGIEDEQDVVRWFNGAIARLASGKVTG
jgi:hypothetical protein